jgi:hypothetical protein
MQEDKMLSDRMRDAHFMGVSGPYTAGIHWADEVAALEARNAELREAADVAYKHILTYRSTCVLDYKDLTGALITLGYDVPTTNEWGDEDA